MAQIVTHYHVDAPPDRVFELGAHAERIPEWNASITEVKDVTGPLDHLGAAYTAIMKIAGRRLEARWEVARIEKPSYTELRGSAPGGGRATMITRSEPAGGGSDCTFELDYELPGGFIGDLAFKLFAERSVERDVRHSNENFKAIVEAEVPVHA